MQCHRYDLSDFDGGEEKSTQRCLHAGELVARATTAVCIDVLQMGVGGIDSWGNKPLAEHLISAQEEATCTFQLLPGRQTEEGDCCVQFAGYPATT